MSKKKIMLSSPMKGRQKEEIDKERNEMANILFDFYGDDKIEIMASIVENHEDKSELECFSESIFFMSQADILAMGWDWEDSRGCNLEYEIAKAYDVPIIHISVLEREVK